MTADTEPSDPSVAEANEALSRLVGQSLDEFVVRGPILHVKIDGGYHVTVETPLSIVVDGDAWEGEPWTAEAADALQKVIHTDLVSAKVVAGGGLRLTTERAVIEISSHEWYESWHLNAPANVLVVCMPGGGIAFFPGDA